jgi:anti-anti-sigma factor
LFKFDLHLEGEIVIISLNGNFEKYDTIEVIEKVEEQLGPQRHNILFVMNAVQSIDNHGVGALLSSMSMVSSWGGKVILADIPELIRESPPLKGRLGEFEIYDTESEALKHFTE